MKKIFWAFAAAFCIAGCVNPTASRLQDTLASPNYVAPPPPQKPVEVPPVKDSYRDTDPGRKYSLVLKDADLRDVLVLLSKESGIPIVGERGLIGKVTVNLENKKLGEVLYAILKPLGYTATIEKGIILAGRPKLVTKTFRISYIKDKRTSTSNTNVSVFTSGDSTSNSGSNSSSSGGNNSGSGNVSVTTTGTSDFWGALESSLEMLVFGNSGSGKRDGSGFVRGEPEKKLQPEKQTTANPKSAGGAADKTGLTGPVSATSPDDPLISSTQVSENRLKQLVVNEIAGIIQITDYQENLDKVSVFLQNVEEAVKRQVLIQAHIIEVSLNDGFSFGVNWQKIFDSAVISQGLLGTASNVFKISARGNGFSILLDAMKEQGNVNILSSPKITALNNQKAVIKLTTKQVSWTTKTTPGSTFTNPVQDTVPQIDEVGIFLDVTPQINSAGVVTMQIHPSVSEVKELSQSPDGKSNKPIIDVREIDTMVDINSGETVVIAGLITDKLTEVKRSVPLLGDIPLFGLLFSNSSMQRKKTELVIMLTPFFLNEKSIEDIRKEHEKRLLGEETFHLINNLGSMVTEKQSRDWITITNPSYAPPRFGLGSSKPEPSPLPPVQSERSDKPAGTVATAENPLAAQSMVEPKAAAPATETSPSPAKPVVRPVTSKKDASIPPEKPHRQAKITLDSIEVLPEGIRLNVSNFNQNAHVVHERKAGRVIVQLPGVTNAVGEKSVDLNMAGFSRARVARHEDGTWVVLHASGATPTIRPQQDMSGLLLTVITSATDSPAKREETTSAEPKATPENGLLKAAAISPATPASPARPSQELEEPYEQKLNEPAVAATAAATGSEQALYREGVSAYKRKDCSASVSLFDTFVKKYPQSPFVQDALYYSKDCLEQLASFRK